MLHAHLHREPAAHFAVIHGERPHLGLAFGNRNVSRPIVPHQHVVHLQVQHVIFGERSPRAEAIHDLHREHVLHLVLASHRNPARRKQRCPQNDGTHGVFICRYSASHVVVSQRLQIVRRDKPIQRHRCARRTHQFVLSAVGLHVEMPAEVIDARGNLVGAHAVAQPAQFVYLKMLDVAAECNRHLRHIGLDIEHAAVVVAHQSHPVIG